VAAGGERRLTRGSDLRSRAAQVRASCSHRRLAWYTLSVAPAPRFTPLHGFAFTPRAARAPVRLAVQHRGRRGGEPLLDESEDISASGVFVHCDGPYTVGTAVSLELFLEDGHFQVEGRVVRVGAGRSGRVGMGILFTQLQERERARIERLVKGTLDGRG